MKKRMYLFISLFFTLCIFLIVYERISFKETGTEGWNYDSLIIDIGCEMYIEYPKGKYLLNISTIDSCPNLNKEAYLIGYKRLLIDYSNKLNSNYGIATFETPFKIDNDTLFINNVAMTTSKYFNSPCRIIKVENERFLLFVSKP